MPTSAEADAYIGLGANVGDARATIRLAIDELAALPRTRLVAASSIYCSQPIDAAGDDYLNAVAWLATALSADVLLGELQRIERRHGRERPYRNAPRTLDLDLLLYGTLTLDAPALTLPHPRMHLRAFVLVPLLEIAPELQIPGRAELRELLGGVAGQRIERLAE